MDGSEDTTHAIWNCKLAKEVWNSSSIWELIKKCGRGPFSGICMQVADNGSAEYIEMFCWICWSIWLDRNLFLFENIITGASDTIERVGRLLADYDTCSFIDQVRTFHICRFRTNCTPTLGDEIKINVDAPVRKDRGFVGVGGCC